MNAERVKVNENNPLQIINGSSIDGTSYFENKRSNRYLSLAFGEK